MFVYNFLNKFKIILDLIIFKREQAGVIAVL